MHLPASSLYPDASSSAVWLGTCCNPPVAAVTLCRRLLFQHTCYMHDCGGKIHVEKMQGHHFYTTKQNCGNAPQYCTGLVILRCYLGLFDTVSGPFGTMWHHFVFIRHYSELSCRNRWAGTGGTARPGNLSAIPL